MEVDLHLTQKCNLACLHCFVETNSDKEISLSTDMAMRSIPEFKKSGVLEVHLTGGEPMLHHDFFEIARAYTNAGIKVKTQSNGLIIDRNKTKMMKSSGINSILISIDGLESSHNNFRHNNNSFESAINAAKLCIQDGLSVRINTVLHKGNYLEIPSLLDITSTLGIYSHSFFGLSPIGRGKDIQDHILSHEEWNETVSQIVLHAKELGFSNRIKFQKLYDSTGPKHSCHLTSKEKCTILHNGDVYSCVYFVGSKFKLGNIYNRNFSTIWHDDKNWNTLNMLLSVQNCNQKMCSGGCKGYTYATTGRTDICDPRCKPQNHVFPCCSREYVQYCET